MDAMWFIMHLTGIFEFLVCARNQVPPSLWVRAGQVFNTVHSSGILRTLNFFIKLKINDWFSRFVVGNNTPSLTIF